MSDSTDYDAVNVPDGKSREEYSYVERRAEILDRIERAGHPDVLNKSQLAREYGVSHTSIGRDFDALAENLDRDHSFIMDRVLRGAVRNLVEDGEHYKAVKAAEKWYDFLADTGEVTPGAPRTRHGGDRRPRANGDGRLRAHHRRIDHPFGAIITTSSVGFLYGSVSATE